MADRSPKILIFQVQFTSVKKDETTEKDSQQLAATILLLF